MNTTAEKNMIRFLVFGDLHYDEMPDGDKRVDELLQHMKECKPDFCVSLGDYCRPSDENKVVVERIRQAGVPVYFAIGNHETDRCRLEDALAFYSMQSPYYSFVCGEYKFLVLDSCYWNKNGKDFSYYGRNYKEEGALFPVIPSDEMEWLKRELQDGRKYIIFSHHSLVNTFRDRGIQNREDVQKLFQGKSVLLCMNGHDHGDAFSVVNSVSYYTVNSASYMWAGTQIMSSAALAEKYGHLHGILPYKQALHVLVEIDESEIRINGMDGAYQSVTPEDIGLSDYRWNGVSVEARTSSRSIKFLEK